MADADMIIDAMREQVLQRLEPAMVAVGDDIFHALQLSLSTPYPPASVPGESPHLRTGELRLGISVETERRGEDTVVTTVKSERPSTPGVPETLENTLNRPILRDMERDMAEGGYVASLQDALGVAA